MCLTNAGDDDTQAGRTIPPGRLVDLPCSRNRVRHTFGAITWWVLYFVLFGIVMIPLALAWAALDVKPPRLVSVLLCAFITAGLLGIPLWIQRRKARRLARGYVHEHPDEDVEVLARHLFETRPRFSRFNVIHAMTATLPKVGQSGDVVRISHPGSAIDIRPIEVTFEPRPLDETDSSFQDLSQAVRDDDKAGDATVSERGGGSPIAVIARNIRLKGGRGPLAIVGFLFVLSAIQIFTTGKIPAGFLLWSVVLATMLLWPATDDFSEGKWFVLPSAILIDFGGSQENRSFTLMYRELSALSVYQTSAAKWQVVVADEFESHERALTAREVELLLACWMSTQEPPDYEKIEGFLGVSSE